MKNFNFKNNLKKKHAIFFIFFTASIRITVDGGTNRWYRYIKEHRLEYVVTPIDIVTGDFDSITQSSIRKAMENGARVLLFQFNPQKE